VQQDHRFRQFAGLVIFALILPLKANAPAQITVLQEL
jgi:hypothetical protein